MESRVSEAGRAGKGGVVLELEGVRRELASHGDEQKLQGLHCT